MVEGLLGVDGQAGTDGRKHRSQGIVDEVDQHTGAQRTGAQDKVADGKPGDEGHGCLHQIAMHQTEKQRGDQQGKGIPEPAQRLHDGPAEHQFLAGKIAVLMK